MSRIKTSFDTSNLDGSTVNDLFESIGLKVLDMWDSEQGDVSSLQNQTFSATSKLERILETPPNKLKPGWRSQLRSIIEEMEPTDFAIYGKRLSLFLLSQQEHSQKEEVKLSTTVETPASINIGDQNSVFAIPAYTNSKSHRSPKSRSKHSHSPKTPKSHKSPRALKNSVLYSSYMSTPPPSQQKPMYSRFPKWLPTMPNAEE